MSLPNVEYSGKDFRLVPPQAVIVALVLIGALGIGVGPSAQAGGSKGRVESADYQSPAAAIMPYRPYGAAICNQHGAVEGNRGCVEFYARLTERFVSLSIEDATGLSVPAFASLGDNPDPDTWIPICGERRLLRIAPGTQVVVWIYPYHPANTSVCPGTATTGTVHATFFRRHL
jgi:hypothetical protein